MTDTVRVSVAYGADALTASPTWTDLDTVDGVSVTAVTVQRGRNYMTDQTQAGQASVSFVDKSGALDPSNFSSPLWPLDPNAPILIELHNPVTDEFKPIYRGLTEDIQPNIWDQGTKTNRGVIPALDMFSLLANAELPPGLMFDCVTGARLPNSTGDTLYCPQTVEDRINALLSDFALAAGLGAFPSGLANVRSGNVTMLPTVYSPGYTYLSALQDAANAEFPCVANHFIGKDGKYNFRGRLSRFHTGFGNPYGVNIWKVGDGVAVLADSGRALLHRDPFVLARDINKVVNTALFTPQGILNADIAGSGSPVSLGGGIYKLGQLVYNPSSIAKYGPRSSSAASSQGLYVAHGDLTGNNGNDECALYSQCFVTNASAPLTAILQATFKQRDPSKDNAEAHWNMLCNVELGDLIEVTTNHLGTGGFTSDQFFVEGIRYDIRAAGTLPDITMVLDLSPEALFTIGPWSGDS